VPQDRRGEHAAARRTIDQQAGDERARAVAHDTHQDRIAIPLAERHV